MVRKNCHWYGTDTFDRPQCNALECMQCYIGKCSFYETEKAYQERQWNFTVKQGEKAFEQAQSEAI